jgi:hypothetical protein
MDNSTKSRLAIDLDALEAQLKNVHHQPPTRRPRNSDPLSELARIVGQDDPYRALLANERAEAPSDQAPQSPRKRRREPEFFTDPRLASQPETAANDDHQQELAAFEEEAAAALSKNPAASRLPPEDFEAALRGILGDRRQPGPSADRDDGHAGASSGDSDAYAGQYEDYPEEAQLVADGDGDYAAEEEPQRRSRRGLVATAAVLAIGAIGFGGFYFSRGASVRGTSSEPPVIMAEKQPTKVQGKGSDEAADPNKQIYETVKQAQEQGTKVVNRDEQPVDLNQALRRDGQTASLPPGQRGISLPQPPQASNLGARQDEPRKVKTVAVRPDGSIVSEGQAAEPGLSRGVAPALQSRPLMQNQAGDAAQGQLQPQVQIQSPSQRQGSSQVTPSAPGNNSAKQQARVGDIEETESRANSPLAIAPVGNGQQPPEQAQARSQPPAQAKAPIQPQSQSQADAKPQQRAVQSPAQPPSRAQSQAQAQPPAQSQVARRVANAPAEPAGASRAASASQDGSFVVQLAAPGSEQEARETFASLQRKHASELSGRQPIIRQAQVSGRTIWRLRVSAPSREDAVALCNKLQAAGGACFVAKN